MSEHYMNPFDFVPLPPDGPRAVPAEVLKEPRYEGYIEYSLEILTPLHITGKIEAGGHGNNIFFTKKYFYREHNDGPLVIPGSSIRGMLSSYIEALTASDFGALTIGNEKKIPYAKQYHGPRHVKNRHVGFKMHASDHPEAENKEPIPPYRHFDLIKNDKVMYERNITLPVKFGQRKVNDITSFLFGVVNENEKLDSFRSRLLFDDIIIPNQINTENIPAWDVVGLASMGSPNPRANTAWYFTYKYSDKKNKENPRKRKVGRGSFETWEVLADKIRGRKFYFHQDPQNCFEHYEKYWKKPTDIQCPTRETGWADLKKYDVESLVPQKKGNEIKGRIDFRDMPLSLLKLVLIALELGKPQAHKLGGLKPFGFGSVRFKVGCKKIRSIYNVFSELNNNFEKIYQSMKDNLIDSETLIDPVALKWLTKISHFPDTIQNRDYIFIYPPYRQEEFPKDVDKKERIKSIYNIYRLSSHQKGFAHVEQVKKDFQNKLIIPSPGTSEKITLFFDHYQKVSSNFNDVMGEDFDYNHVRTDKVEKSK